MIVLTKEMGAADLDDVTNVQIGASWDTTAGASRKALGFVKKRIGTDIDLFAVAMQGNEPVRFAGLDSLDPLKNGSLTHSGDNQTGAGEGDDELVAVDLTRVPSYITSIVFVAAAYKKGSDFSKASNVAFTVYDVSDGKPGEVATIMPSLLSTGNATAVAKVFRAGSSWKMQVINETGRVAQGDQVSLMRFCVSK